MKVLVYHSDDKAAVAQRAYDWEEAGYVVDMFEDRTPDGEPDGWTVLAFPLREVR
jgi:hypothetical protein